MSTGVSAPWVENRSDGRDRRASWRALLQQRDVVRYLAARDLRLRYRQVAFGVAWVILQPAAMVAVLYLAFHKLGHVSSGGAPYVVFALAGLVTWSYFSAAVVSASDALVSTPSLVTKVYITRLAPPVAATLPPLVDLAIGMIFLAALCVWYGVSPTWRIVALPLWLVLLGASAIGVAQWLAAVNVRYRDVRYAIGPLLQVLFFVTPVAYSAQQLHGVGHVLYALNPLVGTIEVIRFAVLGAAWPGATLLVSALAAVVITVGGSGYFRRAERTFADVI